MRILNAFVKPCSSRWGKVVLDSMNLPDKTRVTFAERFVSVLVWYFSSKNSESGAFCCRLQIHEIVKACYKLPKRFFHYCTQKIVNFSQTVNFSILGVFDAINKSIPQDCERNLSPMILVCVIKWYTREIRK